MSPDTSGSEARPAPVRGRHTALALLTLAYTLNFLDRQVLTILIVPIQEELGVSDAAMGALAGLAFALLFTLAGIPFARWADRGVRRDILALGLLLWSAATALSALARSYPQLLLARVGVGVGEASCVPAAHSLISDLYPRERRASALAVFSSGIHLGILLGLVLGGWICQAYGWRTAFAVAGLPGILLALVVRLALREPARESAPAGPPAARESLADAVRELARVPGLPWLCLGGALTSAVGYGFATWSPAFLERIHHLPRGEIGTTLGLISGLCGAAGTLCFGALADRLARHDRRWMAWLPALALALAIPSYAGFVLCTDLAAARINLGLAHFLAASWFGPVFAATQSLVRPQRRALAASLLLFVVTLVGLGLGPTLVGLANDGFRGELGAHAIVRSLLLLLSFEILAVWALVFAARRRTEADERANSGH